MKEKIKTILNWINKNKVALIMILAVALIFVLVGCFIIDFGINSKFFIKKSFNRAFEYRITGDCDSFISYLSHDIDKWKERCEKEKISDEPSIRNFKIQSVSHKFGSDRSFLQVELMRNINGKDYSYSASYEMKRVGFIWKIDQEMKK
ncbi:hypothetical protein KKE19_02470 [Patescibacteria group bacterium]|nr:hypothetical protein [Patescibacteria group bacterium]MBU4367700.1 hypothetical protein [Patescibacteria group bacterium]MBU4461850.1 hypothetical protein [Patescibacteria group bacterium]MCG2700019.1 hypothetical protein [Candidatus Parcubacteria bacterium]